jgi:hypothetical protein
MADKADKKDNKLTLRVSRVRTRLAATVKTGSDVSFHCYSRTDPTDNGIICPTQYVVSCHGISKTTG